MSKLDLIDIIITEKTKNTSYTDEDDELSKEEANNLLKHNNFERKELKENNTNNLPEVKQNLNLSIIIKNVKTRNEC